MYASFFGFSEKPFDVTPDPKFLYPTPSHHQMLDALMYGIRERKGFIAITGEVGTGKTTLLNAALDKIEGSAKVAYLWNTALTFDQLLFLTLLELGLIEPEKRLTKIEAIRLLRDFTIAQLHLQGNVVLIIDEAHILDSHSMESLRLLSNLETTKHKLIQIVLAGQPELDARLAQPELRHLAERISIRKTLRALKEKEVYEYIQHRLTVANYAGPQLFGMSAQRLIYKYSAGVPRRINILCDNALLMAFDLKIKMINESCITKAAQDLNWTLPVPRIPFSIAARPSQPKNAQTRRRGPMVTAAAIALAIVLVLFAWFLGAMDLTLSATESLTSIFMPQVTRRSAQFPSLGPSNLSPEGSLEVDGYLDHKSTDSVRHANPKAQPLRKNREAAAPVSPVPTR